MIDMVDDLLTQLKKRGLGVEYVSPTQLRLTGNTKDADAAVMAALKAFKPRLLEKLRPAETPAADPTTLVTKQPNYADRVRSHPLSAPA